MIRALPGEEAASGYALRFGGLEGDPLLAPHARQLRGWWAALATTIPPA